MASRTALVLLALVAAVCGAAVLPQIAGGENAAPHEFPHAVSVQLSILWLFEKPLCSGTLIAPGWVLTSAHCVKSVPWYASAFVLLGKDDLAEKKEEGQQSISVRSMLVHKDFTQASGDAHNDIALLQLKSPAQLSDLVQPALLPRQDAKAAGFLTLTGWGSGKEGRKMQKVVQPVIPIDKCNALLADVKSPATKVDSSNICIGDATGRGACQDDIGGPLVQWNVGKNAWVVSGVAKFGFQPCDGAEGKPSIFTRVSAYVDWIQENMKN